MRIGPSQTGPRPADARPHRAGRDATDRGRFFVTQFLRAYQQQGFPLAGRQRPEHGGEVRDLGAVVLCRLLGTFGMSLHGQNFAPCGPGPLQKCVPLNGEEPRLGACARLELGGCSQSAQDSLLHKIVGAASVTEQKSGIGAEIGQQINQGAANGFRPRHAKAPRNTAARLTIQTTEDHPTA
jgi:hypothetical protein